MAIIFISATSTNVVVMFCGRCNLLVFLQINTDRVAKYLKQKNGNNKR